MTRPLQARADSDRIAVALQQLQSAHVTQFVTDDAGADLTAFGLQPPDLDLWLARGTNFVAAIHVGKNPTNDSSQVYARREGWNSVVTVAREPLAPWFDPVNSFRDPHLLELTAPIAETVAEIEVRGTNNFNFIVRRQGTNNWQVAGETFPVDADSVQQFSNPRRTAHLGLCAGCRAGLAGLRTGDAAATDYFALGGGRHEQRHRAVVIWAGADQRSFCRVRTSRLSMPSRRKISTWSACCHRRAGISANGKSGTSPRTTWRRSPFFRTAKPGRSSTTARTNGRSRRHRRASLTAGRWSRPRIIWNSLPPSIGSGAT